MQLSWTPLEPPLTVVVGPFAAAVVVVDCLAAVVGFLASVVAVFLTGAEVVRTAPSVVAAAAAEELDCFI